MVILHRQNAQTELQAVLLLPALPAAALFLSWGKITGSLLKEDLFSFPMHFLATHAGCWSHGESVPNTPLPTAHFG